MPWHPPSEPLARPQPPASLAAIHRIPALAGLFPFATEPSAVFAGIASTLGISTLLAVGLALYFVLAELMAWLGATSEEALAHLSRSTMLERAPEGPEREALGKRLDRIPILELTARFLSYLGNALLVLGIAYLAFRGHLDGDGTFSIGAACLVVLIAFSVTFLINDVLARIYARRDPERFVAGVLPFLGVAALATAPLRVPLVALVRLLFRVDLHEGNPTVREEVLETVEEGEREGSLSSEEAGMIESIIDLQGSRVEDVMVPRADMVAIQVDTSLVDALALVNEAGFSRIPVYRRDRDDIVGVLYARDLLARWHPEAADGGLEGTLDDVARPAFFVPESKSVAELLQEMRTKKVHLAVVLDEHTGTTGLVTIEDLLEEIVGEIQDEYDDEETASEADEPSAEEIASGTLEVDGRTTLEEINRRLGVEIPLEEGYDTASGLVFHRLGRVPVRGDRVEMAMVSLTVLDVDERTVRRLQIDVQR